MTGTQPIQQPSPTVRRGARVANWHGHPFRLALCKPPVLGLYDNVPSLWPGAGRGCGREQWGGCHAAPDRAALDFGGPAAVPAAFLPSRRARAEATPQLTVVSWGGAFQDAQSKAQFQPAAKALGITVKEETYSGLAELRCG